MKLVAFQIQNYRSILDSGWVEVDDIAVIVGKNESGKTSLLKALWKLNPFKSEPYSLDREWPRGHRKTRSLDKPVARARFELSESERDTLHAVDPSCATIASVEVTADYAGKRSYHFLPAEPANQRSANSVNILAVAALSELLPQSALEDRPTYEAVVKQFQDEIAHLTELPKAVERLSALKTGLLAVTTEPSKQPFAQRLGAAVDKVLNKLTGNASPLLDAQNLVNAWLPTFIYMDDYRIFKGSAQLNELKARKDRNQLNDEDYTVLTIMAMSGLNLDEEARKATETDREQRILDMNDASQTLTNEIAGRWSQKKYEVQFQADGNHFITFVKDAEGKVLVPLEERSKGFQWFFSFDMTFMHETKGAFKNAVILLDEPGLHLHASAQEDLLARMKAYGRGNQLIYTTHLPFMIDLHRLDNIWVAADQPVKGTVVNQDWASADEDARFTLQAALGLSWAQSLFVGPYNLVVEGITDFWFLSTISALFASEGLPALDERLVITPCGGATKVAYVATILKGQKLHVAAMLDSDKEGQVARDTLVKTWILKDVNVLMLGSLLECAYPCALEDLFAESYYVQCVEAAYKKELDGRVLPALQRENRSIVERVADKIQETAGVSFNKGRVAKVIMKDLSTRSAGGLPDETKKRFGQVFDAINACVHAWTEVDGG